MALSSILSPELRASDAARVTKATLDSIVASTTPPIRRIERALRRNKAAALARSTQTRPGRKRETNAWSKGCGIRDHDGTAGKLCVYDADTSSGGEVKEETGVEVRVLRQVPVPPERGYLLFEAELAGLPDVTPEVEACEDEIHTIGAGWHPVTEEAPLGPMESAYWAQLAHLIRGRLRGAAL